MSRHPGLVRMTSPGFVRAFVDALASISKRRQSHRRPQGGEDLRISLSFNPPETSAVSAAHSRAVSWLQQQATGFCERGVVLTEAGRGRHRVRATRIAIPFWPLAGLPKFKNQAAPALKREAEKNWGKGAVVVVRRVTLPRAALRREAVDVIVHADGRDGRGCLLRPSHISARHLRNARRPGISGARWKVRRLE